MRPSWLSGQVACVMPGIRRPAADTMVWDMARSPMLDFASGMTQARIGALLAPMVIPGRASGGHRGDGGPVGLPPEGAAVPGEVGAPAPAAAGWPAEAPGRATNTIKLVLTLCQDRPFTDVSTQPMPGWTAAVINAPLPKPVNVAGATITKAPHTVIWTVLPGTKIAPGEYQNFSLATDALPAAGEMALPVAQYYSDGTVVSWSEPTVAGQPEPEHPAPAFTVTPASATCAISSPAAINQGLAANAAVTTSDNTARVLGGIALLVTVAAGVLVLLRRSPRTDVK